VEAVLHIHHHLHGSSLGYLGIALAAAASWAGVPGPGEPVLIAAGILAARGRLDLAEVLAFAWLGAMVGGVAGWAAGRRAGHALLTAPGPLRRHRIEALRRGERMFMRFGVAAVYVAPSWVAGSTGMAARRFLVANAVAVLAWSLLVGVGGYVVGPAIADAVGDVGLVGLLLLGAVVLAGLVGVLVRRVRRR
jgi:membrane protein DedA with SNARE-associated domain